MKIHRFLAVGLAALIGCVSIRESKVRDTFGNEGYDKIIVPFKKSFKIKYTADKFGQDYWQNPAETEKRGAGDCEDMAFYLQELWKKKGITSEVVFGYSSFGFDSVTKYLHAWNEISWNGRRYIFDLSGKEFFDVEKESYRTNSHPIKNMGDKDKVNYLRNTVKQDKEDLNNKLKDYFIRNGLTNINYGVGFSGNIAR